MIQCKSRIKNRPKVIPYMVGVGPDDLSQVGRHLPKGQTLATLAFTAKAKYTGVKPVLLVSRALVERTWSPTLLLPPAPTSRTLSPRPLTPVRPSLLVSYYFRCKEVEGHGLEADGRIKALTEKETQNTVVISRGIYWVFIKMLYNAA